jgi:hypothetical protein
MYQRSLADAVWQKSTFSGSPNSNCVEVAELDGGWIAVRDSKDPAGPALLFTAAEWIAFRMGVCAGEFN